GGGEKGSGAQSPPVTVGLGTEPVEIDGRPVEVEVSARVFDFGVVSLRARIRAHPGIAWGAFERWGGAVNAAPWNECLGRARDRLLVRIAPAVEQAAVSPLTEDYTVFRVHRLLDGNGAPMSPKDLRDDGISRLLLGETRTLAESARRDLLSARFAYFEDDLAVLTWASALVIEP